MQDQNQKNRQQDQGQQGMGSQGTNWQSQGNQETDNNQGNNWDDNTEIDMPQQPRHKEEPVTGTSQNSDNTGREQSSPSSNTQPGQNSGQQADLGSEDASGNRMGNDMGNRNMSSEKTGPQDKESDDYMRNDIGSSISGSSGSNRSADKK